jgi:hypothetical protein
MEHTTFWLSIAITVAMSAFLLPSVTRMNHGRLLRHTALWLLLVLGLALFYQAFGPFGDTGTPGGNTLPAPSATEPAEPPPAAVAPARPALRDDTDL